MKKIFVGLVLLFITSCSKSVIVYTVHDIIGLGLLAFLVIMVVIYLICVLISNIYDKIKKYFTK